MEIQISGHTRRSISMVSVSHPDEHDLVFSASGYSNAKPGATRVDETSETGVRVALFEEINEMVVKLPPEKQLKLYDVYASLDSIFSNYGGFTNPSKAAGDTLFKQLSAAVAKIYKIIKFSDLRDYVVTNPKIKLPPELSDEYVTSDKITPLYKDRTYRLTEYIDLCAIAMGLRFMIPVWGAYLPIAGKEHDNDMKEYHAYKLLEDSELYKNPAFSRLETYVRANLIEGDFELSVVFKHMSSEEIPIYLMALGIIRKLSIAPLSAESEKDHLMKIIYNYVLGNNTRLPMAFGANIRPKTDPEAGSSEDNSSVWCIYKMKEQISTGDLVMTQIYITNHCWAAEAIEPEIDYETVREYVAKAKSLDNFEPREAQNAICCYVMSTVIAACVVEMFDSENLLTAMGIAQAVLTHWGFPQLAILLTALPIKLEEGELAPPAPRTKISPQSLELLNVINPYTLPENKRGDLNLSNNPAVRGIDLVAADLWQNDWEPRCTKELAASYHRSDVTRRIEVSANVRDELASLLIKLDGHNR